MQRGKVKWYKRAMSLLLCCTMVLSGSSMAFASETGTSNTLKGGGTEENPWLIEEAGELAAVASLTTADAAYLDDYYAITKDLDMEGITFTPIGQNGAFSGVLDGRGHQISNLTIQSTETMTGLFSRLTGTVKNLGIASGTISGQDKVGAIAGRTDLAKILNCYSKADISGGNDVGGLVGMFNNSNLENCYVMGTVTGNGTTAGGLVGGANRSPNLAVPAVLKNCYSAAKVNSVQFAGAAFGYDESTAGYEVIVNSVYYQSGNVGVGNNDGRSGVTAVSADDMTNGKLLEALNANAEDGYSPWVEGMTGYPEFSTGMSEIGLVGLGTEQVPYQIRTAEDLLLMSDVIRDDAQYADDFYALKADLDLDGIEFRPIGWSNHFSGVLDGCGHKISNLRIVRSNDENVGLIGFLDGGTVKNLGIENGTVTGGSKVGAIAGRTMHAVILNCYSKANVNGSGSDVGGITGMFNNSRMENCFVWGTISSPTGKSVGGLSGSANRSIDPDTECVLENCYSVADVGAAADFGTVVGYDESVAGEQYRVTFTNIYYEKGRTAIGQNTRGELTAADPADFTNGVLIETLNANRREDYREWLEENSGYPGFEGKVFIRTDLTGEGTEESPYRISGADDLTEMARVVNLSNEYAKAHYKMTDSVDLKGIEFAGIGSQLPFQGVFDGGGHVLSNVDINVPSGTNVGLFRQIEGGTVKNLGIESGKIQGGYKVGAIAGRTMHATILNCWNYAKVKGFEDVGGLVGMLNNSSLLNSYNGGVVTGSKSLGGLAGSICRSLDEAAETNVKNCYNLGRVHWGTYSGKIAGYIEEGNYLADYEHVYYNRENVPDQPLGNIFSNPETVGVTGIISCTEDEMEEASFVDVMNAGVEDGWSAWKLGADKRARLAVGEDASKAERFAASIEDQPKVENGKLVMPVSESGRYKAVLYGSSNRQVVDLAGNVYTPLTDKKVYLIYDIVDTQAGDEVVARLDRNIILDVAGSNPDAGVNEMPNVVPGLQEWYGREGNFVLSDTAKIVAKSDEEMKAAQMLKMFLEEMAGVSLEISENAAEPGDIVLRFTPDKLAELGDEGYYVDIDEQIVIEAPARIGMQYGGVSIAQILYQDVEHVNIPKGVIRDYPKYEIRGGMMDVARRFFELDYVEEMAKYMAWFKMNTLHLHINEDGGLGGEYSSSFVVESKKYPALNTYNTGYIWSQDDYRQMQKNVKEFGIHVITEIDTPGHATIFQKINPAIVNGSNFNLSQYYDECLELIKDVFDEYLDGPDPVFQGAIVNIGTDESSNGNENMRRYINDLAQYCLAKDNVDKVSFWGNQSLYYGETVIDSEHLINQIWDSADQRVEQALEEGYQIINSTSNSMYIIPGNGNGLHNGYVDMAAFYDTWGGTIDFDTNRQSNPTWIANRNYYCAYDLLKGDPKILGTLFCNWNDRSWGFDADIMDLVLSYVGVISEKCWYGDENRFAAGSDFVKAFEAVGDYGPDANPRGYVDSDTDVIANYHFEVLTDGKAADESNGYDADVHGAVVEKPDENYKNGNALKLSADTEISLPFDSVGYPYTVNFDIYLNGDQDENAVLFQGGNSTFYLNYEGRGVGFTQGKYGFTFDTFIPTDQWVNVTISSVYVHGGSAATILKMDGTQYNASMITHPDSVSAHSATSFLGTVRMFGGMTGYLDNLAIGNKYNQSFGNASEKELEGEGTKESPYLIRTAADLVHFSNTINSGEKQDAYFRLEKDLDMGGKRYVTADVFRGTLDGGGHVISNLTINQPNGENVGLVGLLEGGTIRNLGIENGVVTGKSRVAAIAGRTMYATIENCFAKADVSGEWDCGVIAGMFNNSAMRNCYAWGSVSASRETGGGLVGAANRSIDASRETVIENCYSLASLTVARYGGVIAGYHEGNVQVNGSYPYAIIYKNVFYDGTEVGIGNDTANEDITGLSQEALTDGELRAMLNNGREEGYVKWYKGSEGYPEFRGTMEPGELEAIAEAAEAARKAAEQAGQAALEAKEIALQANKDAQEAAERAVEAQKKAEAAGKAAEEAQSRVNTDKEVAEQAKADAQTAREAAETAKTNAEIAAQNAAAAETAAQTAKDKAEKASQAADNAKAAAETAADNASEAKIKAEAARDQAKKASQEAETARDQAADYQAAAEAARDSAAVQASLAEAARKAAEAARKAAEEAEKRTEEILKRAHAEAEELLKKARQEAEDMQERMELLYEKASFRVEKAKVRKVRSTGKRQLTVTWKKIKGAEGYVLQYGTKSSFKGAKTVMIKKGTTISKKIKKLTSGKIYYVRVKAYRTFDGKKVYTAVSVKKKVRVK